ncbi:MAG: damage-inducible protein DinB [Treponema sp.]|nr:damage-inducible protein DinB [Treponema sp.]
MKEIFVTFAKANDESDKAFMAILNKMSNEDREKNRRSYYGSLSGLARHVMGGTFHFIGMFKDAIASNAGAVKAIESLSKIKMPEGKKLDEDGWKKFGAAIKAADKAYIEFTEALTDKDLASQVKLSWYKGKPASVPLSFMLQQLVAHGIHHRGQISQILDSLKIDNDYSGLNVKFI